MSQTRKTVAYGSWPSPISAARLVEGAAGVSEVRADGGDIWWNEQRPDEGAVTNWCDAPRVETRHDLFPDWDPMGANFNARTAFLEYGGGAWNVRGGTVVFANWEDQRLYRIDRGGDPVAISPVPAVARGLRWSEPVWLDDQWLIVLRESHDPAVVDSHGEAVNELVALPLNGSAVDDPSLVKVLATGHDFVHSPAVHQDQVAWIRWDHPRMPWDGTELLLATVQRDPRGHPTSLVGQVVVAGGAHESIVQPGFDGAGRLIFCSDRNQWWAPYRYDADAEGDDKTSPILAGPVEGEIGGPLWVGGERWWAALADGRIIASMRAESRQRLVSIEADGQLTKLSTPFTEISQVVAGADRSRALVVAGTPAAEAAPYVVGVDVRHRFDEEPTVEMERLRKRRDIGIDEEWFSEPQHHSFKSANGRTAHLLYYPPTNPNATGPFEDLPPLLVMIHGGPTAAARNRLDLSKQFWTSRGFAVADVDYGGSVGYGRLYRQLLAGQWGVVDVEDAVAAADYLAKENLADPERMAIRGGSAGGFTTLAALCFHDTFAAGASHYGVADLSALAADTHKFESRYLDGLVGPWPEARAVYDERSPVHHTEGFARPLIVLQGSEDEVVPPNQAEMIVAALAAKGVPHAYLLFEGEQHGFRKASNIVRALEAELWFYSRVFGFEAADDLDPVPGATGL